MSQKQIFSENQNIAANPEKNIWVQANAGTGKTTVLIQRLLRILFRNGHDDKNIGGVLCLTYTNAAAGEMRNRILADLRRWAIASDNELTELLDNVSVNSPATPQDLAYARKIFFTYIDNPDILKIKTIHSFCEEILHRFPLEAGISPAWSLVSGAAQTVLLQDAFTRMIQNSFNNTDKRIQDAFYKIIQIKSEHFVDDLRELLVGHYKSFFQTDNVEKYREYFIMKTKEILGLNNTKNMDADLAKIRRIVNYANGLKKPTQYITNIINYSQQYIDNTISFEQYKNAYLTKENTIIKNVLKHDVFSDEAERVYLVQQYKLN